MTTQATGKEDTALRASQERLEKKKKKDEKKEKRKLKWGYYNDKSKTGLVGLSNQGATCYMNSLLQTLFMTPEFRLALYKWEYDQEKEGPKKDSIPYQLQKLFANLQLTECYSIETKGLTKSFGWGIRDAFEQHDIQELNRVLFDALEHSFKDTPSADLVNELYQGTMADQIVCQKCNNKISREDKYLDIPLVIRGVSSVEEALDKFVEDEVLDGDNKYFCEKCNEKCAAWKGLKLRELPYLLTLQLKRFDIDYETFDRVKLHNPVSFPRYLNMDRYVNTSITVSSNSTPVPTDNNNADDEMKDVDIKDDDDDDDEEENDARFISFMMSNSGKKEEEDPSKYEPVDTTEPPPGDNIYELYSILIHSGTAGAGHYFAYIKNFENRTWYKFNDEIVSYLKKNEIEDSFGGKKSSGWGSTNAYMLVYRKVNKELNLSQIDISAVPPCHSEKILQFNNEFVEERKEHKRLQDKLTLKIVHGKDSIYPLDIDKNETLLNALNQIYTLLEFDKLPTENRITMENIRLRDYDNMRSMPGTIYTELEQSLSKQGIKSHNYLYVETRKDGEEWPKWDSDSLIVRICLFNNEKNEPDSPVEITLDRNATVVDLKNKIIETFGLENKNLRLFTVGIRIEELVYESIYLCKDYNIISGEKIYVENNSGVINENGEEYSPSTEWIKQTKDTIKLKYNKIGSTTYDEILVVQQFLSLSDLKQKLAEIVGLPIDQFKMKRKAAILFELKDLNHNLSEAALTNDSIIHLEEGKPLEKDQYSFKIILHDEETGIFTPQFELAIYSTDSWLDIKKIIAERLNLELDRIRLREKFGSLLVKIFKNHQVIRKCLPYLNDGKEIVIQYLKEPEFLEEDDVVLYLARFFPKENRVSSKEELRIKKDVTIYDFREMIAQKSSIANEQLAFAKPFSIQTLLHIEAIKDLSWRTYVPREQGSQKLTSLMWFISDGDLFVYKNTEEDTEDVKNANIQNTNNLMSNLSNHSAGSSSSASGTVNVIGQRPRREEKALKIKSRFDKEEEKKQKEKEEQEARDRLLKDQPVDDSHQSNDDDDGDDDVVFVSSSSPSSSASLENDNNSEKSNDNNDNKNE